MPPLLDYATLHAMLLSMRNSRVTVEQGASLADERAAMDAMGDHLPDDPEVIAQPIVVGGVPCRLVSMPGADLAPTQLFLHGGAFYMGSFRSHRAFVKRLVRATGATTLFPEYRLAPEFPYPAALDDVLAVTDALAVSGAKPALIGASAGGGLAFAAAVARPHAFACLAALSPWVDLTCSNVGYAALHDRDPILEDVTLRRAANYYIGSASPLDPCVSPIFADLSGLPPVLIQAAADELLLGDAELSAAKLATAGVQVKLELYRDAFHVPPLFPLASGVNAFEMLVRFLAERSSKAAMNRDWSDISLEHAAGYHPSFDS